MKQKVKSTISSLLKFLLSAGIIYWLVSTGKLNLNSLAQLLTIKTILVCILLMGANYISGNERWKWLLKSQNIEISRLEAWRLTLIGVFFNFVVPGGVGGDVIKAYYLVQENPSQRLVSALTVAVDRLIGLFTMLIMAVMVMFWDWQQVSLHHELKLIFFFLVSICSLFFIFWMVIFSKRISGSRWLNKNLEKLPKGHHFTKVLKTFSAYAQRKDLFFKSFGISFVAQIFAILVFAFVGETLGFSDVSLHTYFFVVPIGFMVTAIPISPAGVGVGQAAFYYLFNLVLGHESSVGISTITAMQILQFGFGLLGAFYYVTRSRKKITATVSKESLAAD